MFSCLLFEAEESERAYRASDCEAQFWIVGWIGSGKANLQFKTKEQLDDAILYIPALLCHESGSRAHLRVTKCLLQWKKNSTILKSEELRLTESNWRDPEMQRCALSYSHIKPSFENVVLAYSGAQSPNDLLLHLGDIGADSELNIYLEFLISYEPYLTKDPTVNCTFAAMLPSLRTSIKIDMSALNEVQTVTPLADSHGSLQHHVFASKLSAVFNSTSEVDGSFGLVVALAAKIETPLKASCHTLLLKKPLDIPSTQHSMASTCHGIQMLSCMPHFGVVQNKWSHLAPCEFLFLVDCSGSMSGLKIQSASEALLLAIKSLPQGCFFNVIAFGSKYRILFQNSMKVSDKLVDKAIQFTNQLQACLGGTELLGPLRWLLKKPPSTGLPRQLFLITDGSVPNISAVLHMVARHKQFTRCHTFALGSEICSELMAGIATETGGRYCVVGEDVRLQTKVMEVVKSCLLPSLNNLSVDWSPPLGYSLEESFPNPSAPYFAGTVRTVFSLLTKSQGAPQNGTIPPPTSSPIVSGSLSGKDIQIAADCSYETNSPNSDTYNSILHNAAWAKMNHLNDKLLTQQFNKNNVTNEEEAKEPATKKPRLNGLHTSLSTASSNIIHEIVSMSLSSHVPYYPYTHFKSSDEKGVCQVLPWNGPLRAERKQPEANEVLRVKVPIRKRQRDFNSSSVPQTALFPSLSLASIAKKTTSSFGSVIKTAVNVATFGLVSLDDTALESGERIEDRDYYQNEDKRIHWDENKHLILPSCYYQSQSSSDGKTDTHKSIHSDLSISDNCQSHCSTEIKLDSYKSINSDQSDVCSRDVIKKEQAVDYSRKPIHYARYPPVNNDISCTSEFPSSSISSPIAEDVMDTSNQMTNEENMSQELKLQPNYLPLVQLQLSCGGWPLLSAIAPATCVPMEKIVNLPLRNGLSLHTKRNGTNGFHAETSQTGHFWATALALACLRVHYYNFFTEWELISLKAEAWLEDHRDCLPMSLSEAQEMAVQLVSNHNYSS